MAFVYKITNLINNKMYIGKTSLPSIEERFKEHIHQSRALNRNNKPLYNAFNKYGVENFTIELIEEVENDEIASERERYWINELKTFVGFKDCNGYNATLGGDGSRLHDYKELANAYLELKTVQAVCDKYHCTLETVRNACKENNIIIRKPNSKQVKRIDMDGNIQTYDSVADAARDFPEKFFQSTCVNIAKAARKKGIGYGYYWEYINE